MDNKIICTLGFSLLFSSFFMMIMKQDNQIFINLDNTLNDEQKVLYRSIIKDRSTIYMISVMLGLLTGYLYFKNNSSDKYVICKSLVIIYVVKFSTYYFFPKKPLLLYSLDKPEQVKAWADVYTTMKTRCKYSMIMGFISYLLLGLSYSKK